MHLTHKSCRSRQKVSVKVFMLDKPFANNYMFPQRECSHMQKLGPPENELLEYCTTSRCNQQQYVKSTHTRVFLLMNNEVSLLTIHHAIKLSLMFNKTLSQIELRENKRNFQSKLNKSSQKLQVWTNGYVCVLHFQT